MADISKLKTPDGTTYNLKDEAARNGLAGKAAASHTHTKSQITDFPTSLPASGGNADTVDNKHASDFAAASHTHDDRYYTESEINTKLNTKLNTSLKGAASGLAELDSSGKVPSSQLPSYVDDVLEYNKLASFPSTGETGKIYVAIDTNKTYRWSGSAYTEISPSLALGETSSTAYRGDRGKIAYDHSQTTHAPSNAQANIIETIKVNGTALTPSSKAVNITVPTNNNQLTNGAGYITSSGTAKTISDTLPISKGGTGQTTGANAANTFINSLSIGDSAPEDNDYFISQYAGGSQQTYYRRPVSKLWEYIKGKADSVYAKVSHGNHVPTTQTANNAVFLRNDNTWATVTPANIGAAVANHSHNYAGSSSAGGAATTALACTGNAATATKATQDSAGQKIDTTYIKGLSASSGSITYTKGDNTTGTITIVKSVVVTLSASGWNSNSQTISVSEVNANSIVFITPALQSQDEYIVAYINCTNQDNGSLTFTCKYIPENDLQINLVIL